MPLVAGLVMASGRRSIEVVSYLTANFKPTKNKLEAEFTTNAKTKEEKTYRIPLLVDYETFESALTRLRKTPRISKLLDRVKDENSSDVRNRLISNSIQHQLSQFIKGFTGNDLAELKDGRAMYARIAYVEYCSIERKAGREPNADDLFFQERLGHTEPSTQQSYKKFVVTNEVNNRTVKQTKNEAIEQAQDSIDRLAKLKELFKSEVITDSKAFSKYAEFIIEQVSSNPLTKVASTFIKSNLGGNKGIILQFVKIVKEAGLQNPL